MKIKIKNTGTIVPKNLTQYDVGYDLVASSHPAISGEYNEEAKAWSRIDYIQYHTDLYIEPVLMIKFIILIFFQEVVSAIKILCLQIQSD